MKMQSDMNVKHNTAGTAITFSSGLEGNAIACKIQKYHFHEEHLTVDSVEFVSLNCSIVHGAPANTILWSNEKYWHPVHSVSVPGLWSSLQIRNVTQKDAGTYRCEVKKGTDKQVCEVVLCKFVLVLRADRPTLRKKSVLLRYRISCNLNDLSNSADINKK